MTSQIVPMSDRFARTSELDDRASGTRGAVADVLSDVLRSVRLTGAVYFDFDLTSPWVAEAPASREIAAIVMPGAQRVIEYHLIARGACWGHLVGEPPLRLHEGDLILFRIEASHFVWRMVRRLAGVLVKLGKGEITEADFDRLLKARCSPKLDVAAWTAPDFPDVLAHARHAASGCHPLALTRSRTHGASGYGKRGRG